MKSNIESFCGRMVAGAALAMLAATSNADGGHDVPLGVSVQQHLHLSESLVVSPVWMVVVGVSALVLSVWVQRRRRSCCATH